MTCDSWDETITSSGHDPIETLNDGPLDMDVIVNESNLDDLIE